MVPVRRTPLHANKEPRAHARARKKGEAPATRQPWNKPCGQHVPRTRSCTGHPTTGPEGSSMIQPYLAPAKPLNFRPSALPAHGQPENGSHLSARTRHSNRSRLISRPPPSSPQRRIYGPRPVPKPTPRHEYVANERQFNPQASQNGPKPLRTAGALWHNESSVFVWKQPYGYGPKVVLYASSLHFAQGHSW